MCVEKYQRWCSKTSGGLGWLSRPSSRKCHDVVGEDGKVMGTERRLTLVGETSISATLFTEPGCISGGLPCQFLEVKSDTKRAGRTMTLTKP